MTWISDGVTTITPELINGYEAASPARSVQHIIIDREDDDVSLAPAGPRTGKLTAVFSVKADAWALHNMLRAATVLELGDDDVPEVGMTFVMADQASIRLDPETQVVWLVEFGFKEVGGA